MALLLPLVVAHGAELYDSGGFEPPRFVAGGALQGQDAPPTGQGPWVKDGGTSSGIVQTSVVGSGLHAVQITRSASATGDTRWFVTEPFAPSAPGEILRIELDLRVEQATFSGTPPNNTDFGPAFGLEAYDSSTGTPRLIGSMTVDATTGDVLYQTANAGFLAETGTKVSRGLFHHFTLALNFTAKTYSIFADNVPLRTEGFVDSRATRFTDAPIVTFAATGTSVNTATGTAYFDNYAIASIPEPATTAMLLAGACLSVSRRLRAR